VGDLLELRDGSHEIRIQGPRDYTFRTTLHVAGREVKVTNAGYILPDCGDERKVDWPTPKIQSDSRGVQVITLLKPVFVGRTGVGECAPMMISCSKLKLIVTAKSDPQGAEIWVDDERATIKTDATLSVPYCESAKSVSILLRMNGRTNCRQDVNVSADRRVLINCKLPEP
jgi:hypothetical protein